MTIHLLDLRRSTSLRNLFLKHKSQLLSRKIWVSWKTGVRTPPWPLETSTRPRPLWRGRSTKKSRRPISTEWRLVSFYQKAFKDLLRLFTLTESVYAYENVSIIRIFFCFITERHRCRCHARAFPPSPPQGAHTLLCWYYQQGGSCPHEGHCQ